MEEKPKRLGELLVEQCLITKEQLAKALEVQKLSKARLGSVLINLDSISEEDLLSFLSLYFDCPYVDLRGMRVPQDIIRLIPEETALQLRILPIALHEPEQGAAELIIATSDPTNMDAAYQASRISGYNVLTRVVSDHALSEALLRHYSPSARPDIDELARRIQGLEAEVLAELINMLAEKGLIDADELMVRLKADQA